MRECLTFTFLAFSMFILTCCTGSKFVLEPDGELGKIKLNNNRNITGELISVQDQLLYVRIPIDQANSQLNIRESMTAFHLRDIKHIEILQQANRNWVLPWITFQVLPPVLLGAAANSVEGGGGAEVTAIFLIPAFISGLLLYHGTPDAPQIVNLLDEQNVNQLRKFTRFPLGLDEDELNTIAKYYGQESITVMKL